MNKTVKKVFMLLALLVGIFLAWQMIFNDGGIIQTGYTAIADGINGQYEKVAGKDKKILPDWGNSGANTKDANGQGFDIDTK